MTKNDLYIDKLDTLNGKTAVDYKIGRKPNIKSLIITEVWANKIGIREIRLDEPINLKLHNIQYWILVTLKLGL